MKIKNLHLNAYYRGIQRYYSRQNTKKFYVTTPIYYVNAAPHIGHLYSSVIADTVQRWQHLLNPEFKIIFASGTDEHGIKVQQAALKHNVSVSNYCNAISSKYKQMSDVFRVGYTRFIRTTDEEHKKAVTRFWENLDNNGYVYLKKYAGWYCIPDETFLTDSQLKKITKSDGQTLIVSAESGHQVEWTEEENYMFKLSAFQDELINWLTKNENSVKPKVFHKILLDSITKEALPDISISRPTSRVHWGIQVPGDDSQTVYVWLDALVNYLTVAGYADQEETFKHNWPPDLQIIGKDILKFHGIYWPAFLLATKLDLPKTLLCHSHWTVDNEKMSKSKNNVVCPFDRSQIYTSDGLRYFLLREGVAHNDGNYSDVKVVRILNSELADTLGNLLSRSTGSALNPNQVFPKIKRESFETIASLDVTKNLFENIMKLPDLCEKHYTEHNFYRVVDSVIATLHSANLFFETLKPWELKKSSRNDELEVVLHITLETLRISAILLKPIIPNLTEKLLNKINIPDNKRYFKSTKTLSWNDDNFSTSSLSPEKLILFKRIISESDEKKKAKSR